MIVTRSQAINTFHTWLPRPGLIQLEYFMVCSKKGRCSTVVPDALQRPGVIHFYQLELCILDP